MAAASTSGEVTKLLKRVSAGDRAAEGTLIELVYRDLRKAAGGHLKREREGHSLQPTELVDKAFLRLCRDSRIEFQDRAHFFRLAGIVMRRILVDHARSKKADKRGRGVKTLLDDSLPEAPPMRLELILDVDRALTKLEAFDERMAQIVNMRFFAGLSEEEIGTALGVTSRTVKREWSTAKAWLRGELSSGSGI